jgi:hypothetical protein|tara:strand:- start:465 stop:818 length:354 start_codon:yes stop_codon:yes gene_type:complete
MTIKLVTLKSGEDVICDLSEVTIPHENGDLEKLVAYSLHIPYAVKLSNPQTLYEAVDSQEPQISFFPWQPLSPDEDILIPLDWVVCITNPAKSIKQSYIDRSEMYKLLKGDDENEAS